MEECCEHEDIDGGVQWLPCSTVHGIVGCFLGGQLALLFSDKTT